MRVVCFGDSVTRGITYISGRLRILKENYPALLERAWSTWQVEVHNKGLFNDNSDLLVQRVHKDVLSLKPNLVIIAIGGNDCNFKWDEVAQYPDKEHEAIVPITRYLENIKYLVNEIRTIGAKPLFLNLLPLDPARYYKHISRLHGRSIAHWIATCGGIAHWHAIYNKKLQHLLLKLDVKMIDVRQAFLQSSDLSETISEDGIHPTLQGYQKMSQVILEAIQLQSTQI